ncbi:probable E3 ubiquitin-protein ligase DTX2 isoform X1 [Hemiscyllium ocellatum]|uniref:probable E3 ubiquitin-protein ligase DTX2 isoform X1 n=1 Tax=Hemiscyllium ocellatum TaxID=170820 RepID=UPI0029666613|nr:probable E3 ubiquitin-protein ligase DTX2 isoform X1 [Hemiscyllium ocellatum]
MATPGFGNGGAAAAGGGGGGLGASGSAFSVSPFPVSGSGAGLAPLVAVWEWEDEAGRWRPYSSRVSEHIERSLQHLQGAAAAKGINSISLGQAEPRLAPYIIDIPTLTQFRQDTGRMRRVRRQRYAQSSAPGQGLLWQWENDEGGWTAYETPISIFIEDCLIANQQTADLGHFGYNYIVNFTNSCQINKTTGFRRRVQRLSDAPYPSAVSGSTHGSQICSCNQCLAYTGSGPISNRSRYTVSNLAGPSTQLISNRSSLIMPHNHGYSPYNKRPASGGPMPFVNPSRPVNAAGIPGQSTTAGSQFTNGSSIQTLPVQLNGPNNVFPAFAGMTAILMCAAGLPVCFTRATKPVHKPDSRKSGKKLSTAQDKSFRRSKKVSRKEMVKDPEEVVNKYMMRIEEIPDEDCIICMEKLSALSGYDEMSRTRTIRPDTVGKFTRCGHVFHLLCMMAMYENGNKDGSLQCPSCKTIYGEKTGTQPKGKMDIYLLPQSLPGYADSGSIQIVYNIPPGIQGPEHPNPGKPYTARGFPRHCYLPYSEKGRQVLELLKVAWNRRLIFTVGTSSTTGEMDTVVWNEIHHKTEMGSNVSGHGYPDPNYLDNVIAELAAQGVTEDCLRQ